MKDFGKGLAIMLGTILGLYLFALLIVDLDKLINGLM